MSKPEDIQPLSLLEAVIPIASLVILVGLAFYLFGDAGASSVSYICFNG